jgi:hypothetical protein
MWDAGDGALYGVVYCIVWRAVGDGDAPGDGAGGKGSGVMVMCW